MEKNVGSWRAHMDDEEVWRIGLAQELIDCKSGVFDVPGFQREDLDSS